MLLTGNEEDKMKRISPVLFLTLASAVALNGQTSVAQSQSTDLAPGPIAELLPDDDGSLRSGFNYPKRSTAPRSQPRQVPTQQRDSSRYPLAEANPLPERNALPEATTSRQAPVAATPSQNALPLFDRPAQPQSSSALITSTPPSVPQSLSTPRTPGDFFPGSVSGATAATAAVGNSYDDIGAQTCTDCQSDAIVISEDNFGCSSCGETEMVTPCDTCGQGVSEIVGQCDTCGQGDEMVFVEEGGCQGYDDCGAGEFSQPVGEFYDTGAQRIDGRASHKSNRRKKHKGIFARHHAKHLAKKQAKLNQGNQEYFEADQYAADQVQNCDVAGGCGVGAGAGVAAGVGVGAGVGLGGNGAPAPAVVPIDYGQGNGSLVNNTIGANYLYFNRNYEDDRQFSASRFANERGLFSNDADHDDFGGFEVNWTRRKANGSGFEARYFSLEPSQASRSLGGGPFTTLGAFPGEPAIFLSGVGVQDVFVPGPGPQGGPSPQGGVVRDVTAAEVYNFADVHEVTRDTSIQNVEFNLLRLGRVGQHRGATHEYLVGFRYFKFDESFGYNASAFRPGNIASDVERAEYLNEVTNQLYGAQIGGRTEIGFFKRFSLIIGTKAGIFNNSFSNSQNVSFLPRGGNPITAQVLNGPFEGQVFDTEGEDSQITMIGELDLGISYRMFRNSRLRAGYRALFVSDVAFAVPQTEVFFSDISAVQSPNDNDDLFLQGGYIGAEFAF